MSDHVSDAPQQLAQLMSLAGAAKTQWRSDDLAAMWRHQLDAPLEFDLSQAAPDARTIVTQLSGTSASPLRSFGDLLRHPSPPVDLLRMTKDFGRSRRNESDAAFPPQIATALYYAAIGVAMARHHLSLTELDRETLRQGLQWTARLAWMDQDIRQTLQQAIQQIPTT